MAELPQTSKFCDDFLMLKNIEKDNKYRDCYVRGENMLMVLLAVS